jgi:hypothetical protein
VGRPLTGEVNAFTLSLVIYPVIVTGLLLYRAGRVGPGFWALVSGGGAIFVSAVHFGPSQRTAGDDPRPYDPPVLGWLAFTWLVIFVAVLVITSLYETRVWWQQRQARRTARPRRVWGPSDDGSDSRLRPTHHRSAMSRQATRRPP